MSFAEGHKKSGGRKKGTPNKKSLDIHDDLEILKLNPFEIIQKNLPLCEPEKQIDVSLCLLQYLYPKRKAIEIDPPKSGDSHTSAENPNEQLHRLRQMLKDEI